jgi:DNA-directed RNA polymerase sigma subunit (sigma70/sigma32)
VTREQSAATSRLGRPDSPAGNPEKGFGLEESGAIAEEAARGRALDRELADELEHRAATTRAVTGRYIHALGQRERMPSGAEQALVRAARAGDPDARAALVEALLPLIGTVARNYRTSRKISLRT